MITVDATYLIEGIKFPNRDSAYDTRDYFVIVTEFPNKHHYIQKGLDYGITLVAFGGISTSYAPKAISRWKHNLRKQLGKRMFQQAMIRTVLLRMKHADAWEYLKALNLTGDRKWLHSS